MKQSMNLFYILSMARIPIQNYRFVVVVVVIVISIKFIRRSISTAIKHTHTHSTQMKTTRMHSFELRSVDYLLLLAFLIQCGHINIQVKFNSNELIIRVRNN